MAFLGGSDVEEAFPLRCASANERWRILGRVGNPIASCLLASGVESLAQFGRRDGNGCVFSWTICDHETSRWSCQ